MPTSELAVKAETVLSIDVLNDRDLDLDLETINPFPGAEVADQLNLEGRAQCFDHLVVVATALETTEAKASAPLRRSEIRPIVDVWIWRDLWPARPA